MKAIKRIALLVIILTATHLFIVAAHTNDGSTEQLYTVTYNAAAVLCGGGVVNDYSTTPAKNRTRPHLQH